ncbi:glycosyltransferase family 39 protein [Chlorogloeopsis sp. ULAP01]|uniref:glycosyltransferase family 39 protein n=1 Tax=Chlorogloeopsis sp. ULAP01 TaxID=3056483 RepID=UPI0025AAD2AD|nr:glycosyltransferase family 39 protein [Chlorogloeopsis sp. ULAP01]MDM9379534.1 glycosyltransferase family 39 protein [Chlorogloeopsis sp. ULAP01]
MINHSFYLHYLGLTGVIALGIILRFYNLDLKPLWMDEIITAIFSLGKNYHDLPLDVVLPIEKLQEIFIYQPGKSCAQIAQNLANQSTHPPLFFCWMYSWLGLFAPLGENWIFKLRSLPALFGVGAIAAIYCLNRLAFSKAAGLTAAMLMAVSPFTVYLSQEARHYTLPMLLITLSLLGLIQIQLDIFQRQQIRFWIWLSWTIINIIGLYVHYFFILALIAEFGILLVLLCLYRTNITNQLQVWLATILSISTVTLSFLPWLPVILRDYHRPETNWLYPPNHIAPFYQTLLNWILMVIALPVERQPLAIAILSGVSMLCFGIWLGWQVWQGLKQLWCKSTTHLATLTLLSFFVVILLEFFAIAYFLEKDITAIPRYSFVYYPSFCSLVAASLIIIKKVKLKFTVFFVSFISCIFVIYNLVFLKPFTPEQVAQTMNQNPSTPLMVVVGYGNYQDVALGLSFALALKTVRNGKEKVSKSHIPFSSTHFAFFQKSPDFQSIWAKLSQLSNLTTSNLNLWVVAPGIKRRDYPQQVLLSQSNICTIDAKQHYRVGVPYQLYRCGEKF